MTSAMRARRDAAAAARRPQYTHVRMRVRFADRSQVEKTFAADARIGAVYEFVDGLLERSVPYTLFESPPRREYARDACESLAQLGLAPAAALGIRWADAALNASGAQPPLRADVRARARDMPAAPTFASAVPSVRTRDSHGTGAKLPRWFRSTGASVRAHEKR